MSTISFLFRFFQLDWLTVLLAAVLIHAMNTYQHGKFLLTEYEYRVQEKSEKEHKIAKDYQAMILYRPR